MILAKALGKAKAPDKRMRQLIHELTAFAVVGGAGVLITNVAYDLLNLHLSVAPVTSSTIAMVIAAIATYLGNRYWSFRARQRTSVGRELVVFAALNGIGLLIQDATVAFNTYVLHTGHNQTAAFLALNSGIALATLFRFWSYRRFVWAATPARQVAAGGPLALTPGHSSPQHGLADSSGDGGSHGRQAA